MTQAPEFRLVPVEPTKLMLVKGENALHRASHGDFVATEGEIESFYRAILDAAPLPAAPAADRAVSERAAQELLTYGDPFVASRARLLLDALARSTDAPSEPVA